MREGGSEGGREGGREGVSEGARKNGTLRYIISIAKVDWFGAPYKDYYKIVKSEGEREGVSEGGREGGRE